MKSQFCEEKLPDNGIDYDDDDNYKDQSVKLQTF